MQSSDPAPALHGQRLHLTSGISCLVVFRSASVTAMLIRRDGFEHDAEHGGGAHVGNVVREREMPEDTGENRIPIVEERARIEKQWSPRVACGSPAESRSISKCCAMSSSRRPSPSNAWQ